MVNDVVNTTRHHSQTSGRRDPTRSTTTTTPSPTPRRTRRIGTSTVLPPPPPPPSPSPPSETMVAGSSSSPTTANNNNNPSTSGTRRTKSVICPICNKDMCHEKALCGHIRWHTHAERQAAYSDIARVLASNFVSGGSVQTEQQGSPKRFKLPDLNQLPPPDDDQDGAA